MLERELAQGEAALARLEADRAQWVEADERRAELEVKLGRQRADLAEAERAEELAERRDGAQDRLHAPQASHGADELHALPWSVSRRHRVSVARLRAAVAHAQGLEFELSELQAEIDTAHEAAAAEAPDPVPPRPMRWLAAAALLVGLAGS